MKEITAILSFLMLLIGCWQNTVMSESPPTKNETSTASAKEKMISSAAITAITATTVQPTTAATHETTIQTTEPVNTAEAAVSGAEVTSTDNTTKAAEPPQTTTSAATATAAVTIPVTTAQQTTPPIAVTEPITEPKLILPNDGTDYSKAKAVYEYMRQNGCGTCVNHSCRTYEVCCENGLQCLIVWTDTGMYGHTANIVNVDGIWYVLDTEGGYFLDYNYCFTEVVDIDGNHIADSSIISDMSYDELH